MAAACLRVLAAALLLSAPAAAAEAAASPAAAAAVQPPRTRTAALLPFDGPGHAAGTLAQAFAPLRQLAASFLGSSNGPIRHGFAVADLGNLTVLQATSGCVACCGTGDCSRAYMDTSVGMCCVSNPPTCCPSGATCTATGCGQSTWGSITGGDETPSPKTLLALVVVVILICVCLFCLMNSAGACCGPPRPVPYGVPGVGYASPVGGFGAPAYGTPAYGYPAATPVYGGGGYGYPGGYGGGYHTGTDVALAGGGGFLGGLGLGYLLGEASQPDTTINYYGGGGDGGQQWIPADGGNGGGGFMPADR